MSISERLFLTLASFRKRQLFRANSLLHQEKLLRTLVKSGASTLFGKTHDFRSIHSTRDFLERVPARTYRDFNVYMDAILKEDKNVLFPGIPKCFGVTAGTEGTPKLIPLNGALLGSTRRAAIDAALLGGLRRGSMSWRRGQVLYIGPRKGFRRGARVLGVGRERARGRVETASS